MGGYADGSYPNNVGGGIYVDGPEIMLRNCTIRGNYASVIGGGAGAGGLTLIDCVVSGNEAGVSGGGVYTHLGTSTFTNCTFAGNKGGGLFSYTGPTITNCVFWGNTDGAAQDEPAQIGWQAIAPTINYTCIQSLTGALGGTGNIGDKPRFKRDGLHLRMRSPARNAGDPGFAPGQGQTDIDGQPRVLDGRVDMGADEVALEFDTPQAGAAVGGLLRKAQKRTK